MENKSERLFCLDVLRGLDMFYLVIVATILEVLLPAVGAPSSWGYFLYTHPWEGFTLYDSIMPLFIFMSGAAVPFALGRRLDAAGRPTAEFHRHVWARVALLWGLGMLAQGGLHHLDWHRFSPYSNTLQTIAVGYVVTAYVLLIKSWKVKIAIPLALLLIDGLLIHFGGDYTLEGNLSMRVDNAVFSSFLPADSTQLAYLRRYGCTWILPSLIFPVLALAGAYSTLILRAARPAWRKAGSLFAFGAGALVVGWLLVALGVKMVKNMFTVSFSLQAIGWSVLALAMLYVITDIWKFRRGMGIFLLFGRCALTAYLCETIFRSACFEASRRVLGGLTRFFPSVYGPTIEAVLFCCVVIGVVWCRSRMKKRGV